MSEPPRETIRPDPLLEDVRKVRAEVSAQFDNNVGRLCEYLRSVEGQYPGRVVASRRANPLPR
jgi:hypothetical protein